MGNVERAAQLYARATSRYSRRFPHGLREWVLSAQRAAIVDLARPRASDRVLDVGCGAGRIAALLRPFVATISGVDACPEMLGIARAWSDPAAALSPTGLMRPSARALRSAGGRPILVGVVYEVSMIFGIAWKEFAAGLKKKCKEDKLTDIAASLTFFAVLARFPFL